MSDDTIGNDGTDFVNGRNRELHPNGSSPYSSGGGGVTFERRVAAQFLARMLTGEPNAVLEGRRIVRVAFQVAPEIAVDDLLVIAGPENGDADLELAIAVRRATSFTQSDERTLQLFGTLIETHEGNRLLGVERRLVICVAGVQPAAQQVEILANHARTQVDALGFFNLIRTPGRFNRLIRGRLDQIVGIVTKNLETSGRSSGTNDVQQLTWQLLANIYVLMPRLEIPDQADWFELVNLLKPWARERTTDAGTALRDRLEILAASYAPMAASVDSQMLKRDAHDVINLEQRRSDHGWAELRLLDAEARAAVQTAIGGTDTSSALELLREEESTKLREHIHTGSCVLVTGVSGVGKSALVVRELSAMMAADPAQYEVIVLNLRLLPSTMFEIRSVLGAPMDQLLAEISTPIRILVIDGADFAGETVEGGLLLTQLINSAHSAGVTPWIVAATDGRAAVRGALKSIGRHFVEHSVTPLTDDDLSCVAEGYPALRRLIADPRAKELLRRPVVVDLFVRAGTMDLPMSDSDALEVVWEGLVRNDGRANRGSPDARDQVLRQLAIQHLKPGDSSTIYATLNPAALDGLRRDSLLRSGVSRWQAHPDFAHEILRTYATAKVLLASGDSVGSLIEFGAPRWSLPAARLASQVLLAADDTSIHPIIGRFASVQASFDRLTLAGHADRWADIPCEAVLTLPNSKKLLSDAWLSLQEHDATGLRRILRVLKQRHSQSFSVEALVAEPFVELLLSHGWPRILNDEVDHLLRSWLATLVITHEPAGNGLRIKLRNKLVAAITAEDDHLVELAKERTERLASRTSEQILEDAKRASTFRTLPVLQNLDPHNHQGAQLPSDLTDDSTLETLALLGADLGEEGERLLRRVAEEAPQYLAPALEEIFTGNSLATFHPALLVDLVEAYYLDGAGDKDGTRSYGFGDDGVRPHHSRGPITPLAAYYYGPFLAMFRKNFRNGVTCLNRILNHAAKCRVRSLSDRSWSSSNSDDLRYGVSLEINGETRLFIGDSHVWSWYRGTSVGPYPCMSALQALELVTDEYIKLGVEPAKLVPILLNECENLAMPALIVGILVRHLELAGKELDPFLADPNMWKLEFSRVNAESSGLAASRSEVHSVERRTWSFREVAAQLAFAANESRARELRAIGQRLVNRARELDNGVRNDAIAGAGLISEKVAVVKTWAGSLDKDAYQFTATDGGYLMTQVIDEDVVAELEPTNHDLRRSIEATRVLFRYPERYYHRAERHEIDLNELVTDIHFARELSQNPPASDFGFAAEAIAAVAAAALESRFLDSLMVPEDDLLWSARMLLEYAICLANDEMEDDFTVLGRGAERSAARAISIIMVPEAGDLRLRLETSGINIEAINRAMQWVVTKSANECRLFFARSLDLAWKAQCDGDAVTCHHARAFDLVEDISRDCLIGSWKSEQKRNRRVSVTGPLSVALDNAEHESVDVARLSPTIRASAAAAVSAACCSRRAAELLRAALAAHRRGMHDATNGYYHSADDSLIAARGLLDLALSGDSSPLIDHITDYIDDGRLLAEFLRALAAVGEESNPRGNAANRLWPTIVDHVLDLVKGGRRPNGSHHYEWAPFSSLLPTPSYDFGYLHREVADKPILWIDVVAMTPQIDRWVIVSAGSYETVDALVNLLHAIPKRQQALLGLPWVETLVMVNPGAIANCSFLLPEWLESIRHDAESPSLFEIWQRIVDALTVAGDERVARLAD